MSQKFSKSEKLKSKIAFAKLFSSGHSVKHFPVRMVFVPWQPETNLAMPQVGFSVSKKRFKKAVDRNRVKRQMKEAYRLNKSNILTELQQTYAVLFIYLDHQFANYATIENGIKQCLIYLAENDKK